MDEFIVLPHSATVAGFLAAYVQQQRNRQASGTETVPKAAP